MAISSPLELEGSVGTTNLFSSVGTISGEFEKAKVIDGNKESVWVIYDQEDWDHEGPPADPDRVGTVMTNGGDTVDYGKSIVSAQGFDKTNPGVVFFEHSDYRGFAASYQHSVPDLTDSFPQGTVEGVSSIIVTGGTWNFYKSYNYTGTKISVDSVSDFTPSMYNFYQGSEQAKSARINHTKVSGPLTLTGDVGETIIFASTDTIEDGLVQAEVLESSPGTLWVIYELENWGRDSPEKRGQYTVLQFPDLPKGGLFDAKAIRSAQGFDITNPGIILFEQQEYTGYGTKLEYACPDVMDIFLEGSTGNILSAIITGGTWMFYDGFNYTGKQLSLNNQTDFGPGMYNFNDAFLTVKSIWNNNQAVTGPLQLSSEVGKQNFYASTSAIRDDFNEAIILPSNPPATWVLYNDANWNRAQQNQNGFILNPGEIYKPREPIRSIQGFDRVNPGAVVFELIGFRGRGGLIQHSIPDLRERFPSRDVQGISSVIINFGFWTFYMQPNYSGAPLSINGQTALGPGRYDFARDDLIALSVKTYHDAVSSPLRLSGNSGFRTFFASNSDINPEFHRARVMPSQLPSLWVLYTVTEWNRVQSGTPPGTIIRSGESMIETPTILSVQGYNIISPGIIAFEKPAFHGYGVQFRERCDDFTLAFPQDQKSGVSSVIITGGTWKFYTEQGMRGSALSINGKTELGPGEYNFGMAVPTNTALSADITGK